MPGPDLEERVDAVAGHVLDRRDPVDAGREVLDQLAAGALAVEDGVGIGVGEEGGRRLAELDVREDRAHACRGLLHERRVRRDADRQDQRALGAELLGDVRGRLDRGTLARHHDLAGRVAVRDGEDAVLRGAAGQLRQLGVVEAEDRGHGPVAARAARLHQAAALTDQSDAVGQREGARGDHRRVLAHRVAGVEARVRDRHASRVGALMGGGQVRDRRRKERRLRVLRAVQRVLRALEGETRDGLAEGLVGRREDRGGGARGVGEGATHAD